MSFKSIPNYREQFMANIRKDVKDLCDEVDRSGVKIELDKYKSMRLNSYEQKYISTRLSNSAFAWYIEQCLQQVRELSAYELPTTYEEFLHTDGIRELMRRVKEGL